MVGVTSDEVLAIAGTVLQLIGQSFGLTHFFYAIIVSPIVTLFKFGSKQKGTKEHIDAICTVDVDCPVWEKYYDD